MPDNKKRNVTSKKGTTVGNKSTKTSVKEDTVKTKKVATEEVHSLERNTVSNKAKQKKTVPATTLSKVRHSGKKQVSNDSKSTVTNNKKKKSVSKESSKKNTSQEITEKVTKEKSLASAKKSTKQEEKGKSKAKLSKSEPSRKKEKSKKTRIIKLKKITEIGFYSKIKDWLEKKKTVLKTFNLKKKKRSKVNISLVKREQSSKKKKKNHNVKFKYAKKLPLLTKNTKKWLILVSIICAVIIILEGAYFIYHQIEIDRHTTYYDSLNSLSIDDTDIVSVGSSQFKYSKYYDYTKGLEKAKFIKYDKDGNIVFEKMYENGINTTFSSVITVSDGYVVVGSGEFSEQEQQDGAREAIIIKYDKDGNVVWEKYYQVVTNTRFNKVIAVDDGYVVVGQSIYANMEMGNHTTGGGIIVKYDFDGNEVWHNNHGGMKSGNFNDVVEVNSDLYVVGKDATDSANIVKYNHDGEYQWHKNYSYTDSIGFTGITYLDHALYVVGSKKILPEGISEDDNRDTTNTDALLVKYDLDGNILFEKNFGGSNYERYNSILVYRDNLYIVGHTTSSDAGFKITTDGDLMTGILVRYDQDGNILKKETLGGSNNDNLTDVVTDGVSLYISGYSNSNDGNITTSKNNGKDYFGKVIKLDFKFRTLMVK